MSDERLRPTTEDEIAETLSYGLRFDATPARSTSHAVPRSASGHLPSWVVRAKWDCRHYDPAQGRKYKALGTADDLMEADGAGTLTFAQAENAAVQWFGEIERNRTS